MENVAEQKIVPTLAEVREEANKAKEAEQHQSFLLSMEGKASKELTVAQLSYLYKEHKTTYEKINTDKEAKVENIEWLDKMAQQKKATTAQFEEQKAKLKAEFEAEASIEGTEKPQPQPTFKLSDKAIEDMIDRSIERLMKDFKF